MSGCLSVCLSVPLDAVLDPDFVVQVKCTIFWLNRGLRVYLDLYGGLRAEVPTSTLSTHLFVVPFMASSCIIILERRS